MTTSKSRGWGIGSLSFRSWLVVVMIFPMAVGVTFGYSAIHTLWTNRSEAIAASPSSLAL